MSNKLKNTAREEFKIRILTKNLSTIKEKKLLITWDDMIKPLRGKGTIYFYANISEIIKIWQSTKNDQEATDDDQNIKTINALLKIFNSH